MDIILTRRSIRKYRNKDVSDELVEKLLKAAMSAPSAGNQQPWHFIVVRDREILDEIPKIHPYSAMLKEAPLAIVICGDVNLEKYKGYWVQDCSAATQNLLLAAHHLGLGAVWLGVYPVEERVEKIKKLFNMPESVIPLCIVAIGYPAEEKPPADRFDKSRIHYDKW